MRKLSYALYLIFIFSIGLQAQTKVTGTVYDEMNEPMPFASVYFKGTTIGVTTNENGKFTLSSDTTQKVLVASFVGYTNQEVVLKSEVTENLKVRLTIGQELQEVLIVNKPKKHLSKKENPAYRILQGIWANKKKNGVKLAKAYDYERYSSISLGLSNLDSVFLRKIVGNGYDSVAAIVKEERRQNKFIVPVYMKETNEHVYGNNLLNKERIDMEAERSTGLNQRGFIFDRISNTFTTIDVYEDDIVILNKAFVSPISTRGYGVYEYLLKDSIVEGGKKTYHIYFFPRESADLVFEGSFKVTDKTFALTEISMRTNKNINLSLVRNLYFEKYFETVNDTMYLPTRDYYEGDFTLFTKNDDEKGFYVKKNLVYSDYTLNQPKPDAFYDGKITQIRGDQFEKEDQYWKSLRASELKTEETRKVIQDLKSNKKVRTVTDIITVLSSGYMGLFDGVQVGYLWQLLTNNNVEGLRIRAGFRTYKTDNDRFRAMVYGAYGTKDKKFKYGAEAKYLLSFKPRIVVGASHLDDNLQLGGKLIETDELLPKNLNTNVIIGRGENYFLSRVKRTSVNFDFAFSNNLHMNVSSVRQQIKAADPEHFSIDYADPLTGQTLSALTDYTSNISLIYTPGRYVYGFGVDQKLGTTLYPTIILKYIRGNKGVFGGDFDYNKIQMSVNKPIFLSNFGTLKTNIEFGKVFDAVPLPLLNPITADQTFSVVPNSFSLLNYYDFVTDTYLAAHFEHHFNGLIMNRIPLIKKLKWRSLIFYRFAYGSISQKNIDMNRSFIAYQAPSDKVYSEYGFGFENIGYGNFRPFRVDFIWRNDFTAVNGKQSPGFGVRFGFIPEF